MDRLDPLRDVFRQRAEARPKLSQESLAEALFTSLLARFPTGCPIPRRADQKENALHNLTMPRRGFRWAAVILQRPAQFSDGLP